MAVIVIEGDDRSFRVSPHGLRDRLGGRSLIAGQHEDTRGQCPERRGIQARWTYERQGSNRLRTRRGETAPVGGHTSCAMHPIQTQLSEELHQSLVDGAFQCAYASQWTWFHSSRSSMLPGGSAGGGSSPSLYNRAALPHSSASGVREGAQPPPRTLPSWVSRLGRRPPFHGTMRLSVADCVGPPILASAVRSIEVRRGSPP